MTEDEARKLMKNNTERTILAMLLNRPVIFTNSAKAEAAKEIAAYIQKRVNAARNRR